MLRKEGERYDERNIVSTVKWGGSGAMVWECFWGGDFGPLGIIDTSSVDQETYINILANRGFEYWSAQSPDLNPIEHVWNALERQIERKISSVKSLEKLKMPLREEWARLDDEFADRLVRSMKRRSKIEEESVVEPSILLPEVRITELAEPSTGLWPIKRCKTHGEVIETIFGARLDLVARTVIDGTIDSAKLYTVSIITKDEHGSTREKPVITSSQETTGMISDLSTSPTTKALICQKIQIPGTFSFPSPIICDDSYFEHRLRSLPKANILQEEYTGLDQNQMNILNENWVQGQHLRLACAQLLAGCILVDQE
ncbi:hypothetical protein G6F37_003516 [Rhizopus arrhizus]|nr:hypothetical protein G6F38_003722 [Rhizopus arrhizus]KAG1160944.1 hypothetical protein G6F37_003516 [Rhizopus arrhizus]